MDFSKINSKSKNSNKPEIQKQYIAFKEDSKLDFNAANYSVKKGSISNNGNLFFNHYNSDSDKKLCQDELQMLMADLKGADKDNDGDLSNKEIDKLIKDISGGGGAGKTKKTQRKQFFAFLDDIQKSYKKTIRNTSDGKIDYAPQGGQGDCWFLACANSLSTTEWGTEAIKEAIKDDKNNEEYKVNLKGVDFEATFSYEDVEKAKKAVKGGTHGAPKYSTGDVDMLLLEMAAEKYLQKEMDENGLVRKDSDNPLVNGNISGKLSLSYMLTGKAGHAFFFSKSSPEKLADTSKMQDYQKCTWKAIQDTASNVTIEKKEAVSNILKQFAKNPDNYSVGCGKKDMGRMHEYTIKDVKTDEEGNITKVGCINPWSPNEIKWYSFDDFSNNVSSIEITSKDDTYDEFMEGFAPYPKRVD